MKKTNNLFIYILILIFIILLMLSSVFFTPFRIENAQPVHFCSLNSAHGVGVLNEKRCKNQSEGFETYNNNDLLGGAIVTLKSELMALYVQIDLLNNNIEKIYTIKELAGNTTPIGMLYSKTESVKPIMNAVMDTDVLQAALTSDAPSMSSSSSGSNQISNTNIRGDERWNTFSKILLDLKTQLQNIHDDVIPAYLANVPVPIPTNYTKDQTNMIQILQKINLPITSIINYINNILNTKNAEMDTIQKFFARMGIQV